MKKFDSKEPKKGNQKLISMRALINIFKIKSQQNINIQIKLWKEAISFYRSQVELWEKAQPQKKMYRN